MSVLDGEKSKATKVPLKHKAELYGGETEGGHAGTEGKKVYIK